MILVDTCVWIDFFRGRASGLSALLEDGDVLSHPWVIGEIALGNVGARRSRILTDLALLPSAPPVADAEVLAFVESHELSGSGIGWVDAQLLAAALVAGATMWTSDR